MVCTEFGLKATGNKIREPHFNSDLFKGMAGTGKQQLAGSGRRERETERLI